MASNRDRIERMAAEAAAAAREKKEKAAAKKAAPKKKTATRSAAATPATRMKAVWDVCNASAKTVATFPYSEEQAARAEAKRLAEETGKTHYVARNQVPFE